LRIEGGEADGVLLLEDEPGDGGGEALGVLGFGHRGGGALIGHALAGIDDEMAEEVGLVFVLLQVELVGAAEDFPVEVAQVVAGRVFAVLRELDGETVPRAAMLAGDVALDDVSGP
jgi:hypothetical protein